MLPLSYVKAHTCVHENKINMPKQDAATKFANREIPVTGGQLDENRSHTSTTCTFIWLNKSAHTTAYSHGYTEAHILQLYSHGFHMQRVDLLVF
jgi:hypothetical protein